MYSQFSRTANWYLHPLKKTIIFGVPCPELFNPYCQLTNYSWVIILSIVSPYQWWYQSFPHGAEDSYHLKHYLQLLFFSDSDVTMIRGFDQKVQKSFSVYYYPHLTMSLPDRMIGQSFLGYLNLLHAQGVTLDDVGKSGLVQNEQSLEWSLLLEGQLGLKKDWGVESTADWVQVHLPPLETSYFPFVSFLTSFFRGFLEKLVFQTKVQELFVWFQPVVDLLLY